MRVSDEPTEIRNNPRLLTPISMPSPVAPLMSMLWKSPLHEERITGHKIRIRAKASPVPRITEPAREVPPRPPALQQRRRDLYRGGVGRQTGPEENPDSSIALCGSGESSGRAA